MNSKNGIKISFFQLDGGLDNKAIMGGVYMVEILKENMPSNTAIPLYIGQSKYVVARCGSHLYNFFKDPAHFGLNDNNLLDSTLELRFSLLKSLSTNRKKVEKEYIKKHNPRTQKPNSDRQIGERKVDVVQAEMTERWGDRG